MTIIDLGIQGPEKRLDDKQFLEVLIRIVNIVELNETENFIINLYGSYITQDSIIIIEKMLLKCENVKYVFVLNCPLLYLHLHNSEIINDRDCILKNKLIFLKKDILVDNIFFYYIKSQENRKIILETHNTFYEKYKVPYGNISDPSEYIFHMELPVEKKITICTGCNFASLIYNECKKHRLNCKNKLRFLSENSQDNIIIDILSYYGYTTDENHNYEQNFTQLYNLLYDKILDNFLDFESKLNFRVKMGMMSKKELLNLIFLYKNQVDTNKST